MKHIISSLIILTLIVCETSAQSFLSTNKLWSTMKGPVSGCSSFFCSSYFTKFEGDTLVDGIHYMKVRRSEDQQMQKWTTQGLIREDSNKKVFYRDILAKDECLMYDFGCKAGDTLSLNCVCGESGFLVDSIKTVVSDGVARKYFYLTYLKTKTLKEVWIEGIGSTLGVLNGGSFSHCMTGGGEALLCYSESGIKKYQSPMIEKYCYLSRDIFTQANAQLKVDAGNDIVLCFWDSSSSTAQLGGHPTASGGVEPYKFTWSGKLKYHHGPNESWWVYASYFLNDTTISNPTFKRGKILYDWPVFQLKVEDAAGNVQYDSVRITDGSILILNIYTVPITIKRGDSVQFFGDRYFYENYKFIPFKLSLTPTYGLTDPSNLYTWAKPDTSTTYYLQAVNTVGCAAKAYYWRINVDTTTNSNNLILNSSAQCYLENGDLVVKRAANNDLPYQLTIATANGAIIYSCESTNWNLRLSNLNLKKNQLYIVSITDRNQKENFKIVGR